MEVTILNRQRGRAVDRPALTRFVERLIDELPPESGDRLGICLVSNHTMREYNRRFRGKTSTTDVLSFPSDGRPDPDGGRHVGDILISVPRAEQQAREAGHSLERELHELLVHGYLHLLGYDHETDDGTMLRVQRRLLRRLREGDGRGAP